MSQQSHISPTLTATPTDAGEVAVIGATGKTGRRVADRLEALGVPVRRASRTSAHPFDWQDESTWTPVLEGASAAYVAYVPDLAVAGAPQAVTRLATIARDAGVQRLVLLSGRGEEEAQRAEAMVAEVFPSRVVVRCAFFAQNFDESFLLGPLLDGTLALPVGDVREPFVDLEDVAEVAVAALVDDAHAGRIYELTGPRALTFAEAVADISAASGRELQYVPITMAEFSAALTAMGVPEGQIGLLEYLFTEVLDGRGTRVEDGVFRALGREATDFRDYAAREAADWMLPGASA